MSVIIWSVCHEPWSQSAQHHDPNIKHIPPPDKNHFSLSPDGWITTIMLWLFRLLRIYWGEVARKGLAGSWWLLWSKRITLSLHSLNTITDQEPSLATIVLRCVMSLLVPAWHINTSLAAYLSCPSTITLHIPLHHNNLINPLHQFHTLSVNAWNNLYRKADNHW